MIDLKRGSKGEAVARLQALLNRAGFPCKPVDGDFGPGTARMVSACQAANGLTETGIADAATQEAIGMDKPDSTGILKPVIGSITVQMVDQIFPAATPRRNIETFLPPVLDALRDAGMDDKELVLMALATIRAESEGFEPIDEGKSKYNTDPGAQPFNRYDAGTRIGRRLGNSHPGDGARYKGRGFIQLTGRENYRKIGRAIGEGDGLEDSPDRANDPVIAAKVLAQFLKEKQSRIKYAILGGDLAYARKLVNGGSHGLDRFEETFGKGAALLPA